MCISANDIYELRELSCRNSVITKVAFEMFPIRGLRYPLVEDCAVSSSMVRTFITSNRKMRTWILHITSTSTTISSLIIRAVSIIPCTINHSYYYIICINVSLKNLMLNKTLFRHRNIKKEKIKIVFEKKD